jgi:hypothetical protein
MMRGDSADEYLAGELERLMAMPLTTSKDVERWYNESREVAESLARRFPEFEPEHELWHFFSDADIRSREKEYRDRQHQLMLEYIHRLRRIAGA